MKKKMAGRSGRSAYEIARDKAESGEDDEDDDGTVTQHMSAGNPVGFSD